MKYQWKTSDGSYDAKTSQSNELNDYLGDLEHKSRKVIDQDYLIMYRLIKNQPPNHRGYKKRSREHSKCESEPGEKKASEGDKRKNPVTLERGIQRTEKSENQVDNEIQQINNGLSVERKIEENTLQKALERIQRIKNKAVELENKMKDKAEELIAVPNCPAT